MILLSCKNLWKEFQRSLESCISPEKSRETPRKCWESLGKCWDLLEESWWESGSWRSHESCGSPTEQKKIEDSGRATSNNFCRSRPLLVTTVEICSRSSSRMAILFWNLFFEPLKVWMKHHNLVDTTTRTTRHHTTPLDSTSNHASRSWRFHVVSPRKLDQTGGSQQDPRHTRAFTEEGRGWLSTHNKSTQSSSQSQKGQLCDLMFHDTSRRPTVCSCCRSGLRKNIKNNSCFATGGFCNVQGKQSTTEELKNTPDNFERAKQAKQINSPPG